MGLSPEERAAILDLRDRVQLLWRVGLDLVTAANVLLDQNATEEAQAAAAYALARDLPPHPKRRAAWRAWQRDADDFANVWGSADEAMHQLLALGMRAAVAEACRPQTVRLGIRVAAAAGSRRELGQPWVKDERGRKRVVQPVVDLPFPDFHAWLVTAAYRHVSDLLGVRPRGRRSGDSQTVALARRLGNREDAVDLARQVEAASLAGAAALATGRRAQEATMLLNADTRLSDRQRRILALRAGGATTREIADMLGGAESTVRVHLHRARSRLRK